MEIKAQKNTAKPHYPAVIKKTAAVATAAAAVLAASACQQQQVLGTPPVELQVLGGKK